MLNINAPQGRIPCAILIKFAEFVPPFRMHQQLKFRWICSRGYVWSYGGFKLTGSGYPQIFSPLAAKLCVRPQKFQRCKNVLEVLYHHDNFGGARISPAAGPLTAEIVRQFEASLQISTGLASWQRYCTALQQWASAKLCGVEQRAPPIFGRAAIMLGTGPHSSFFNQ